MKKLTLKEAAKQDKLAQFVAEREDQPPGDMDAFDRCLTSMAGTKKADSGASSPGPSEDSSGS